MGNYHEKVLLDKPNLKLFEKKNKKYFNFKLDFKHCTELDLLCTGAPLEWETIVVRVKRKNKKTMPQKSQKSEYYLLNYYA
jgi:hypothetical protein